LQTPTPDAGRKDGALKLREQVPALDRKVNPASSYADAGRTTKAIPLLVEASTHNPKDTILAMKVAALQAWLGQDADYAVTRQRMLNWAAAATNAEAADQVAKLACIRPLADASQRGAALALARKAVELGNGSPSLPWFQLALGMAQYRGGQFAEATTTLAAVPNSIVADTWSPDRVEVTANFYRTMSLFKEGKPDEARALFTGTEAKMTPFPADEKEPLDGTATHDDLFLWLACKEAKALLNPRGAAQP
jgi:eukaryotic-like serine/threonine-protein kinase